MKRPLSRTDDAAAKLQRLQSVLLTGAVLNPDGSILGPFTDVINEAFFSQSAIEHFERLTVVDELRLLRIDMEFARGSHFIDPDGHTRFLTRFWTVFQIKRLDDVVQFTQAAYGDARVAYGTGLLHGRSVTVVVTEQKGNDAQFGMFVENR